MKKQKLDRAAVQARVLRYHFAKMLKKLKSENIVVTRGLLFAAFVGLMILQTWILIVPFYLAVSFFSWPLTLDGFITYAGCVGISGFVLQKGRVFWFFQRAVRAVLR